MNLNKLPGRAARLLARIAHAWFRCRIRGQLRRLGSTDLALWHEWKKPAVSTMPKALENFVCSNWRTRRQIVTRMPFGLIDRAFEFGYLGWPHKIRQHIIDKSVLDVGCGTGLHGVGYIVSGADSYTGIDPAIDLDNSRARNIREYQWQDFGWTPRSISAVLPNVRYIPGTFESARIQQRFQTVVMHNVTEHLANLEQVFDGIVPLLAEDGKLVFNHHNFFCWNGHHMRPDVLSMLDESDPEHRRVMDWKHIDLHKAKAIEFPEGLNFVRIRELREMVEKRFKIEEWIAVESTKEQGRERLSEDIVSRFPELSRDELTTQHIMCIARPRT